MITGNDSLEFLFGIIIAGFLQSAGYTSQDTIDG